MMGLNNATSIYSCLWCTVKKDERCSVYLQCICILTWCNDLQCRWDMSVREEVYQSPPPAGKGRTLASLQQNSQFSTPKKHLGSKHTPILQMEPTDIIIDELHLLLRIGDVLLRNVILQADNLDRRSAMTRPQPQQNYIRTLEGLVRKCGISFSITEVICVCMGACLWVCLCLNACVCIHVCMHVHGL